MLQIKKKPVAKYHVLFFSVGVGGRCPLHQCVYGKYWANQNNVINLLVKRIFLFQVPSISSAVHFAKMVIKCKCIHSYPLNITEEKKYCVPLERETRLMCATAIFEPNSIIISNNLRAIKSSILIDSNRTFSITADAFTS